MRVCLYISLFLGFLLGYQPGLQASDNKIMNDSLKVATLGGGCFWCVEAIFQGFRGVEKVESGYSGGKTADPTYESVSAGTTGHVEVVQITFDPGVISYEEILTIFFHAHDPTTLNRQGADVGPQYRSVIFVHDDEQKVAAEKIKGEIEKAKVWSDPLITAIEPFNRFYKAENYHQDYYNNNKNKPYCSLVIAPKLQKIYAQFSDKLKKREGTK